MSSIFVFWLGNGSLTFKIVNDRVHIKFLRISCLFYLPIAEEFSKARDEIAEKQKRTEGILELLYQLNDKRLTFWKIWEFISSVLINERLAEMEMLTSKTESLSTSTQNNSNRSSIKVDITSPPITPNNNNNAQQITTMDTLKLHTFISNLDTYNDLDQLFDLFHEYCKFIFIKCCLF